MASGTTQNDSNRTDYSASQGSDRIAFGAYFVWWSLQVLDRLSPEYDATAVVAHRE
jgi:hypothetical protein